MFRKVLRPLVLDARETEQVANGRVEYRRAIADALVRRLPWDPAEAEELDLEGITRALDLLALEARPVPFEAQTRFARLLAQGPPELRNPDAPPISDPPRKPGEEVGGVTFAHHADSCKAAIAAKHGNDPRETLQRAG